MIPILAIARLTFWEGIRMRIVLVFVIVLIFVMLLLPFALHGDETLAGRLQTFLDYSLGSVGVFLSLATVFLSCSTLAAEIRNFTIHLVVTKPVSRFQILAGKWLGIIALNTLLLTLCGLTIYGFAVVIKQRPEQFERDRLKVRDVVWTARVAALPKPPEFKEEATAQVRQRIAEGSLPADEEQKAIVEKVRDLEGRWKVVDARTMQAYVFENLPQPETVGQPTSAPAGEGGPELPLIQIRYKARGIPVPQDEILRVDWMFIDPDTGGWLMPAPYTTAARAGDTHQFLVRANAIKNGRVGLVVINPPQPPESTYSIHFEGKESLQILYRVSSFEMNFVKSLLMTLLRLSFLSALGLFFSVFVSFPIACLCALTWYMVGFAKPWWMEALGANIEIWTPSADPFGRYGPYIRMFLVPFLNGAFPDFVNFDGTWRLVDGVYLSPALLGQCAAHTLVFGAVLLLGAGWLIFRSREIAQVTV